MCWSQRPGISLISCIFNLFLHVSHPYMCRLWCRVGTTTVTVIVICNVSICLAEILTRRYYFFTDETSTKTKPIVFFFSATVLDRNV